MVNKNITNFTKKAFEFGRGILHLAPCWVPRSFLIPGKRMKLHPDDIYALGIDRGGISERWFASTTTASNGPDAPADEGLSYVVYDKEKYSLKEIIENAGEEILGKEMINNFGGWKVYAKFFDNFELIPFHLHLKDFDAKKVGKEGKPEGYYFPIQLNSIEHSFPYSFFGLEPDTTREDIINCLKRWDNGDNDILSYSKAYKIKSGSGWLLPPGILHAPGTLVTFEVQWASDAFCMYQSMVMGKKVDRSLLMKEVPKEKQGDLYYLLDLIDWDLNKLSDFKKKFYLEPVICDDANVYGYIEKWIIYGRIDGKEYFSAKELTVFPNQKVKIKENGAYGMIVIQGLGTLNNFRIYSPTLIRYNELTDDEYFITYNTAREGVEIENTGKENLVILKYFGPDTNFKNCA